MSPVGELLEVIIYVEDMNAQVAFYREKMGLKVKHPKQTEDFSEEFWVELDCGHCSLALHAGGKRRFGADAPKYVFRVDDILAERQSLIDKGVQLGEIRSPTPGVWVCDGEDPEGNKFSIESQE